jgi:AcrR family transcriptional regulator
MMHTAPTESPLRARLREEVRDAILDAAEEVLGREGLQLGRMEDIARTAGVAVGTVYNHFADRDSLLRSLLDSRRDELLGRVDRAVAAAGSAFREQLDAFALAILAHVRTHRSLIALLVQDQGVALKARLHPSPDTRTLDQLRLRARRIVARGVAAGALRGRDSSLWADLLVGTVRTLLQRELNPADARRKSVSARSAIDFFLNGAGARHGRPTH